MLIGNLPDHFYLELPTDNYNYEHIILILECYGYNLRLVSYMLTFKCFFIWVSYKNIMLLEKHSTTEQLLIDNGYIKVPLEEILKL